jgi:hypothetical protein
VGAIALGALIYVLLFASLNWAALPPLVSAANFWFPWGSAQCHTVQVISIANTYGLVLVLLLMGYGAAEVPRSVRRWADPEEEQRRLAFSASVGTGCKFAAFHSQIGITVGGQ